MIEKIFHHRQPSSKRTIKLQHHRIPTPKSNTQTPYDHTISTMEDQSEIGLLGRSREARTPVVPEACLKAYEKTHA
ncbi:hypothetical protein D1093_00460 [Bartonella kosoyi]|uniref:Uncharacterized protein n=1 Tax=Bartonella kosoyi TaxID=2133959 RepID=A0A5B9CUI8_9HYPH|nr:hypothetical protein [Bartonella kosoyi]QEE08154.1 hypothetical protein D1093_00460 [Bartonella kosoyi]